MQVNKINFQGYENHRKRPLINAKSTGYLAAGAVGITALGGVVHSKFLQKNHKFFAGLAVISIFLHLLTLNAYKWMNKPSNANSFGKSV